MAVSAAVGELLVAADSPTTTSSSTLAGATGAAGDRTTIVSHVRQPVLFYSLQLN